MLQTIFLQASGGGIGNYIMIPLMFLIIYLFMIRPQVKRQKNEKKFQTTIKRVHAQMLDKHVSSKLMEKISSLDAIYFEDPEYYNTLSKANKNFWKITDFFWILAFFFSQLIPVFSQTTTCETKIDLFIDSIS